MNIDGSSWGSNSSLIEAYKNQMNSMQTPPEPPDGAEPGSDEFFESMSSRVLEEQDADADGLLSLEESGFDEDKFNSLDTDGDGQLSQEEIIADMRQMHEKMESMRAGYSDLTETASTSMLTNQAMNAYNSQMSLAMTLLGDSSSSGSTYGATA